MDGGRVQGVGLRAGVGHGATHIPQETEEKAGRSGEDVNGGDRKISMGGPEWRRREGTALVGRVPRLPTFVFSQRILHSNLQALAGLSAHGREGGNTYGKL